MKKLVIFVFLLLATFLLFLPFISSTSSASSGSFEDEIKKVTYYAEEYETGNIDYPRLVIYLGTQREKINEKLGAARTNEGDILKQDQVRNVLGDPKMYTRWVWVEKEDREKKLDKEVPAWDKIVFDGKKIQIRLNAYPSLFIKNGEEKLIYHLNFQTTFKRPAESFDIDGKINEIKTLAETYNSNPASENA
ncbi:MAG: hypothetical protein Q8Q04_03500 [archaeon]|nr:hypothetical protein [archaeon]